MGANFPRVKVWTTTEDVTASDLNSEFDNILNNLSAANVDDFSASVSQMQSTTDPGEVGTESLATSVAGEIQRLRFLIAEITGEDEWYESPVASLLGLANAIGTGLTDNRLVSGRVRSAGTNNMPIFLVPNGSAKTVTVKGTTTNFIYYIDGVEHTISTDVSLTNLTAAPSSNNTCLVNDAQAADDEYTKYTGEDGSIIPVDTMGSEISALVGKFAAFKLEGLATEYFIGFVKSTTEISKCFRGYFFDSADAAPARSGYSNNDPITLMKLTWVFAQAAGTLTATYNNPVWSKDEPTSPAIGDYWYDLANNTWKVYGVGSYAVANATLIGACFQDATNTLGARSFEFFANFSDINTLELVYDSATQIKSRQMGSVVNVWGQTIKSDHGLRTWDITADRDSGVSETSSTYYWAYLTDSGDVVISNVKPFDRTADLLGHYHPAASWRCVGRFFNGSGSDIDATSVNSNFTAQPTEPLKTATASLHVEIVDKVIKFTGASASHYLPPAAKIKGQTFSFVHGATSLTQVHTLTGFGAELIGAANTFPMYTNGEVLRAYCDGTTLIPLFHQAVTVPVNAGATTITGSSVNPTKGTVTADDMWWYRSGQHAHFRYSYVQSVAGTSGTGDYLFALPTNLVADTNYITAFATVTVGSGITANRNNIGYVTYYSSSGPTLNNGTVVLYDTTKFRLLNAAGVFIGAGVQPALGTTTITFNAFFSLPITGWLP
jgi:hypothetical protein